MSVHASDLTAATALAACVSGAGMADCSELIKLELSGSPETLRALSLQLTGTALAARGALAAGGAWWCGEPATPGAGVARETDLGRLIVLGEPSAGARLLDRLQGIAAQWPALRLHDRSAQWDAIAVVGRHAGRLLARLGVYGPSGDPRHTSPFTAHPVGGASVRWLLESDQRAVALVDRTYADRAWRAIERAGRTLGVCCIGQDVLARHALLERRRGLTPLV